MKPTYKMVVVAGVLLSALTGCSQKPPGCADQETRETAKEIIFDEARKQLGASGAEAEIVAKFLEASTVELSAITEDGYVKDAKKQLCRAHVKVLPPGGDGLESDVVYSTQRVVGDDKANFVLSMENVDQLVPALVTPARKIVEAHRRIGLWAGRLDCSPIGGARDGPRGPFDTQVIMKIAQTGEGQSLLATMERSVPPGQDLALGLGNESLSGMVNDRFELKGEGSNTSMAQRWKSHYAVVFRQNGEVFADGIVGEGDDGRGCQFTLTKQSGGTGFVTPPSAIGSPTSSSIQSIAGRYSGDGDGGTVTADIGPITAGGTYPVSLATQGSVEGGGGCAGSVTGEAKVIADGFQLVAKDSNMNAICSVTLKPNGKGGLQSEEGTGCSLFHGGACDFSADLSRR